MMMISSSQAGESPGAGGLSDGHRSKVRLKLSLKNYDGGDASLTFKGSTFNGRERGRINNIFMGALFVE